MRTQVNLSLGRISVPEMIENGRHYTSSISLNAATFATPNPTLLSVNNAINALESAHNNALSGGPAFTAILREKKAIAVNLIIQLGHYVEAIANGLESIILLAGMTVKRKGIRRPSVFRAMAGILPLEVKLQAPYLKNHSFLWQIVQDPIPDTAAAVDPTHTWTLIGVSHKASFIVSDLRAGTKYWFRHATVGKEGQSSWSDPISKMVTE